MCIDFFISSSLKFYFKVSLGSSSWYQRIVLSLQRSDSSEMSVKDLFTTTDSPVLALCPSQDINQTALRPSIILTSKEPSDIA